MIRPKTLLDAAIHCYYIRSIDRYLLADGFVMSRSERDVSRRMKVFGAYLKSKRECEDRIYGFDNRFGVGYGEKAVDEIGLHVDYDKSWDELV